MWINNAISFMSDAEILPSLELANIDLKSYREVVEVCFPTGPDATIIIDRDPDNTFIQGSFQVASYDVVHPPENIAKAQVVAFSDSAVRVTLDAPKQIKVITVDNIDVKIDIYHLENDQLLDEPVCSIENGKVINRNEQDFVLVGQGLSADNISSIQVCSYPTTPRVGIAKLDDPNHPLILWSVPGEIGKPSSGVKWTLDQIPDLNNGLIHGNVLGEGDKASSGVEFKLDREFAEAVERLVQAEGKIATESKSIYFSLVIESDEPCFINCNFEITAHLMQESFPDKKAKQVLRFSGKQQEVQQVNIELPGNLDRLISAGLKVVPSFRGDIVISPISFPASPQPLIEVKTGINVSLQPKVRQHCTAQGFKLAQPSALTGVALALMATSVNAELQIELHEDFNGQPSGKLLVASRVQVGDLGVPSWYTVLFDQPVILKKKDCWLLVKARQGSVIWLAAVNSQISVQIMQKAEGDHWQTVNTLPSVQTLFSLFTKDSQDSSTTQASSVQISLADYIIKYKNICSDGSIEFDLKDALQQAIDNITTNVKKISIPLIITSALPGLITVYPPRIIYDLEKK